MKHAGSNAIKMLAPLLKQLRKRKRERLKENRPGVFYVKSRAFLHFHEDPAGLVVDVKLAGLSTAATPIYPSAEETMPLQPGASVPSACVRTVQGETVDLASKLRGSGALLVFYRGGW